MRVAIGLGGLSVLLAGCPSTVGPTPAVVSDVPAMEVGATVDVSPPPDRPMVRRWCDVVPDNMPTGVRVPAGFCLRRFARVPMPRVLAFAPNGDVFVASPGTVSVGGTGPGLGAIVVLPDDNRDGVADDVVRFVEGLPTLHGLAFDGDSLLYTLQESVRRVPYAVGDRRAPTPAAQHAQVADLSNSERWTHTLARADDGVIYVSVGMHDTSCPLQRDRTGGVLRLDAQAPSGASPVMTGLRNPLYLRCVPPGGCYAMELPHDAWLSTSHRLLAIQRGTDYGYPCCQDRGVPVIGQPASSCAVMPDAVLRITHHHVPLGFDRAPASWPAPYGGAWLVAQHGEVGSWQPTGIAWSPANAPVAPARTLDLFVRGWGRGGAVVGRTADARFAPDGRLFFTDDEDGAVYWIAPRTLAIE